MSGKTMNYDKRAQKERSMSSAPKSGYGTYTELEANARKCGGTWATDGPCGFMKPSCLIVADVPEAGRVEFMALCWKTLVKMKFVWVE